MEKQICDDAFSLLEQLGSTQIRDAHDLVFLYIHSILSCYGLHLQSIANVKINPIPSGQSPSIEWSKLSDERWNFVYTVGPSASQYQSMYTIPQTFVLKALRIESILSVHLLKKDDESLRSLEISVKKFVPSSPSSFVSITNDDSIPSNVLYGTVADWKVKMEGKEELKEFVDQQLVLPFFQPPPDQLKSIDSSSSKNKKDKLRVGATRSALDMRNKDEELETNPYSPSRGFPHFPEGDHSIQPTEISPMYYGDSDLFGAYGRYGMASGERGFGFGGPPSGLGTGGSQVGPHHPIFSSEPHQKPQTGGYNPFSPASGGVGAPSFKPPPPGAKFDPFGPPVHPSSTFGPSSGSKGTKYPPSVFPPPDFDNDMYS